MQVTTTEHEEAKNHPVQDVRHHAIREAMVAAAATLSDLSKVEAQRVVRALMILVE